MKKTEFIFKLSRSIKCQVEKQGGGFDIKEFNELKLVAPSKKNQHIIGDRLQGMYNLALIRLQREYGVRDKEYTEKEIKESKDDMISKKSVSLVLSTGLQDDLEKFYEYFKQLLLKNGICYIGSNEITEIELTDLSHDDFKELMVEYISNFFISCWMKNLGMI